MFGVTRGHTGPSLQLSLYRGPWAALGRLCLAHVSVIPQILDK